MLLSSVPTTQTIILLVPSVEVTKGDPQPPPFLETLQPMSIVGGFVAVIRKAESLALLFPARKAT